MKWLSNFLNKIRFGKNERSDIYIHQIARDKNGKWVTDNEGKLVYKNDDPARIKKFTILQEEKSYKLVSCCGGNGDNCKCKPEPEVKTKTPKPAVKKTPTAPKPTDVKPTATKKPAPKKK